MYFHTLKTAVGLAVFASVFAFAGLVKCLAADEDRQLSVLIFEEPLSWADAREACRAAGGDLASLDSEELLNHVRDVLLREAQAASPELKGIWLGGMRPTEPGEEWKWLNGEPLPEFTHRYWVRNGMGSSPGVNLFLLVGSSYRGSLCANGIFIDGEDKLPAAIMEK